MGVENNKIIFKSHVMSKLLSLIDKVAQTTATVLIQGETGTGKELIAHYIYKNGPLKNKPFLIENCGALSSNLIESEWFGHKKGSFTGAISERKGIFEIANGGTIFLDEIGEMPIAIQTKLLRLFQEGEFRPVGSNTSKKVNVRIIAATNKNLEIEVLKGKFRKDLFYRLNVFQVTIPPLRKRREDIIPLAQYFIKKYSKKLIINPPKLSKEVKNLLLNFDWPGNVRELKNEMEKAVILAGSNAYITKKELSEKLIQNKSMHKTGLPLHPIKNLSLKKAVEQLEKKMLKEVLTKTKGNKSKAARILGITRQGLLNKISKYGIEFMFIYTFYSQIIFQ